MTDTMPSPKPPLLGKSIIGCDWSVCQGAPDVKRVADAGVSFVIAKATQGESYVDPTFNRNIGELAKFGVERGAYHWLSSGGDVKKQIANYVNAIRGKLSMPWAVDFEEQAGRGPAWLAKCVAFVKGVQDLTGAKGMLYTGKWYWLANVVDDSPELASMPLWHAEYPSLNRGGASLLDYQTAVMQLPSDGPHIAPPWESRGLGASIWQFDGDKGLVLPGGTDSDFDLFMGTEAEWSAFLRDPQPHKLLAKVFVPTIVNVQKLLLSLGYDLGPSGADGSPGPMTTAAVKKYQGLHALQVDGQVGPNTTKAMLQDWQALQAA